MQPTLKRILFFHYWKFHVNLRWKKNRMIYSKHVLLSWAFLKITDFLMKIPKRNWQESFQPPNGPWMLTSHRNESRPKRSTRIPIDWFFLSSELNNKIITKILLLVSSVFNSYVNDLKALLYFKIIISTAKFSFLNYKKLIFRREL